MVNFVFKGGPVMYPLLICSIISLTVIIERAIFWIGVGMRKNQCAGLMRCLSYPEKGIGKA